MPEITAKTQLVGLLGYPLEHTLSPKMQNAAFAALGLDWVYLPLRVHPDHLGEALKGLIALGFRGANVTLPHKEKVIPFLDEVSPAVEALGAVNTIVVSEGHLRGENADWLGFLRMLEEAGVAHPAGRALVLGAGGAARAVVYALATSGWEVAILNRTARRASALAEALSKAIPGASLSAGALEEARLADELGRTGLLVNCTSVGMHPHQEECPLPEGIAIPEGIAVCDLVYNPRETHLLARAKAAGAKPISGLGILLHQGAVGFRLWTGQEAPVEAMREALGA